MIGPSDDPDDLTTYSNDLMRRYFKEQIVTFPNSKYVLQSWIVQAAELFDSVIIDNELTISDLPAVQQSELFKEINDKNSEFLDRVKPNVIDASLKELGQATIENCNVPTKDELMLATKQDTVSWDPVEKFSINEGQPRQSFEEQKLAISLCKESIDRYLNFSNRFFKCTGICGSAGSGKTWPMEYILLYAVSQGLTVITTSHMACRAIKVGGKHIAYLFGIPYSRSYLTVQRRADLALTKIMKKPTLLNFLKTLDILFVDEFAQTSSKMLGVLEIIFRQIKKSNSYMGGVLLIFTMDHLQFRRVQEIARMKHSELIDESNDYVKEFIDLVSNICTFVDNWDHAAINEKTYRLY